MRIAFIATVVAIGISFSAMDAMSAGYMAVAHLPGGLALQILDRAMSCDGRAGAFLINADGKRVDMSCNVRITKTGVSVLFTSYGKRVFFGKDQFDTLPAP